MLFTTRRNIAYPDPARTDRPDVPAHFGIVAAALDVDALYNQGTDAARLAASHQANGGRFWWTTDTLIMWYDDGTTWRRVNAGSELDYAQITSNSATVTAASEGAAVTVITGNSVTYDGSAVIIEWEFPGYTASGSPTPVFVPVDGSTVIGRLNGQVQAGNQYGRTRYTPSAGAHTIGLKAYQSGGTSFVLQAGSGLTGNLVPGFLRVTRA